MLMDHAIMIPSGPKQANGTPAWWLTLDAAPTRPLPPHAPITALCDMLAADAPRPIRCTLTVRCPTPESSTAMPPPPSSSTATARSLWWHAVKAADAARHGTASATLSTAPGQIDQAWQAACAGNVGRVLECLPLPAYPADVSEVGHTNMAVQVWVATQPGPRRGKVAAFVPGTEPEQLTTIGQAVQQIMAPEHVDLARFKALLAGMELAWDLPLICCAKPTVAVDGWLHIAMAPTPAAGAAAAAAEAPIVAGELEEAAAAEEEEEEEAADSLHTPANSDSPTPGSGPDGIDTVIAPDQSDRTPNDDDDSMPSENPDIQPDVLSSLSPAPETFEESPASE